MEDPKVDNLVAFARLEDEGESTDQATVDVGASEGHTVDEGGVEVEARPLSREASRLSTILILQETSFHSKVDDIHTSM